MYVCMYVCSSHIQPSLVYYIIMIIMSYRLCIHVTYIQEEQEEEGKGRTASAAAAASSSSATATAKSALLSPGSVVQVRHIFIHSASPYIHTYIHTYEPNIHTYIQAKDMIVCAKEAEKRGDLQDALRLYRAAHLLLPTHQKLGQVCSLPTYIHTIECWLKQ